MSAIEALAAGLPVVSTRVGGMASVVVHGENGLLVEPEDERGFATAVQRVLFEDELSSGFGHRNSEHARSKFSLNGLIESVDELYRDCWKRQIANSQSRALDRTSAPRPNGGDAIEIANYEGARNPGGVGGDAVHRMPRVTQTPRARRIPRDAALWGVVVEYPIVSGSPVGCSTRRPGAERLPIRKPKFAGGPPRASRTSGRISGSCERSGSATFAITCVRTNLSRLRVDGCGRRRRLWPPQLRGSSTAVRSVIAVDVGDAIDVARRNLPADVVTVQADAEELAVRGWGIRARDGDRGLCTISLTRAVL